MKPTIRRLVILSFLFFCGVSSGQKPITDCGCPQIITNTQKLLDMDKAISDHVRVQDELHIAERIAILEKDYSSMMAWMGAIGGALLTLIVGLIINYFKRQPQQSSWAESERRGWPER